MSTGRTWCCAAVHIYLVYDCLTHCGSIDRYIWAGMCCTHRDHKLSPSSVCTGRVFSIFRFIPRVFCSARASIHHIYRQRNSLHIHIDKTIIFTNRYISVRLHNIIFNYKVCTVKLHTHKQRVKNIYKQL